MKIDKDRLRRIISESIDENMGTAMKIKTDLLSTYDRSYVSQAYELCDALGLDFAQMVREMLSQKIDSIDFQNHVHEWVNELLAIFHTGKENDFYIEDEKFESDVQMDFAFKTIADITKNLEDYYVNLFVAIGQGR
tara:strand:+ start:5653 stop:6060 length:408 start_codon:yes stop_codon:yes gene_type:complete